MRGVNWLLGYWESSLLVSLILLAAILGLIELWAWMRRLWRGDE